MAELDFKRRKLIKQLAYGSLFSMTPWPERVFGQEQGVMERDVVIIGAGASGMFAAHHLLAKGYSVAVIEKQNRPGGHSYTHRISGQSGHVDMGVRIYPNRPLIREVLDQYEIGYEKIPIQNINSTYMNFESGEISPFKEPNRLKTLWSIVRYLRQYGRMASFLEDPGYQFPEAIDDELWLPFGEFLEKRKLAEGYSSLTNYLQGFGKVSELPTYFALKNLRPVIVMSAIRDAFIAPNAGVDELYWKMAERLKGSLFLESVATKITRGDQIVCEVESKGTRSIIQAKKLIVACPPSAKNLAVLDQSQEERELFAKFKANQYWTALLRVQGLEPGVSYLNGGQGGPLSAFGEKAAYGVLPTPFPGYQNVLFGSSYKEKLSDSDAEREIVASVQRMKLQKGPVKVQDVPLMLAHAPYGMFFDTEDAQNGAYQKLWSLQGRSHTVYLGAAVDTHGTFGVWSHAKKMVDEFLF